MFTFGDVHFVFYYSLFLFVCTIFLLAGIYLLHCIIPGIAMRFFSVVQMGFDSVVFPEVAYVCLLLFNQSINTRL